MFPDKIGCVATMLAAGASSTDVYTYLVIDNNFTTENAYLTYKAALILVNDDVTKED